MIHNKSTKNRVDVQYYQLHYMNNVIISVLLKYDLLECEEGV